MQTTRYRASVNCVRVKSCFPQRRHATCLSSKYTARVAKALVDMLMFEFSSRLTCGKSMGQRQFKLG